MVPLIRMSINLNSVWLYVGPGPGKNQPHMVIGPNVSLDASDTNITTWSDPYVDPKQNGYSWYGNEEDFRKNFQPAAAV